MRTGHGYQGRHREVVAWTMRTLYKQLVEYCCGSLSSSFVNTQLMFPLDIPTVRFTCSTTIEHQSSGYYNTTLNNYMYAIRSICQDQEKWTQFLFIFYYSIFRTQGQGQTCKHKKKKNNIIQCVQYMLALRHTHGSLEQARSTQHEPDIFSI